MRTAQVLVRLTRVANWLFLLAVAAGLLLSLLLAPSFAELVRRLLPHADVASAMAGMRWLMVLGVAMAVVADRIFALLLEIIGSADRGDPFVAANAARLRRLGWYLLVLQAFEAPGALIAWAFPSMGSAAPNGEFSIAGWLAVLMAFVLSRVFAAGTAMREELEGTI